MKKIKARNTMTKEMVNAENYYRFIFDLISNNIGRKTLECGIGFGSLSKLIIEKTKTDLTLLDIDKKAIRKAKQMFLEKVKYLVFDLENENLVNKLSRHNFDTVILINVMEHIKNDEKLLFNYSKILKKKGKLIIFVPAFEALFGNMDKLAGHYRRYDKKELKEKLYKANFLVKEIFYVNPIGFFAWFLNNKIFKVKNLNSRAVNKQTEFFDKYLLKISILMQALTKTILGQSIFAIAEKS